MSKEITYPRAMIGELRDKIEKESYVKMSNDDNEAEDLVEAHKKIKSMDESLTDEHIIHDGDMITKNHMLLKEARDIVSRLDEDYNEINSLFRRIDRIMSEDKMRP